MTVHGFLNFCGRDSWFAGGGTARRVLTGSSRCVFWSRCCHQSVETLSKGYRHRTCFAQSIIHDPDVLVLDEPTDGLDPNQKHEVRQLIRRMGENKAIIFSTHILEEVDAACSRAIIIDRGRIVANGTPAELRQKSEWAGAVTLRVCGIAAAALSQRLAQLAAVKRVTIFEGRKPGVTARVFPKGNGNGALASSIADAAQGWRIEELHTEEGRLDEVFRSITMPDTMSRGEEMNSWANIKTITKRELGAYFSSPARVCFHCYLSAALRILHLHGRRFFRARRSLAGRPFFDWHPWFYLFLVPAVGMRLWAEERRVGTIELLLTMPITAWQAIVGKFLASWLFLGLALVAYLPGLDHG